MERVAGGPWPFNIEGRRIQNLSLWWAGVYLTIMLQGRAEMEQVWADSGERLTGRGSVGGGQSGEPGQGCDSIRPVRLPGNGVDASLPFSVPVLNGDRTGLQGRDDLTDMLEFICK